MWSRKPWNESHWSCLWVSSISQIKTIFECSNSLVVGSRVLCHLPFKILMGNFKHSFYTFFFKIIPGQDTRYTMRRTDRTVSTSTVERKILIIKDARLQRSTAMYVLINSPHLYTNARLRYPTGLVRRCS